MKRLKWALITLAVILIVGIAGVWIGLNGIVRRAVETQTTDSLNLQTTLAGASVSLLGGNLGLDDLQVASPKGFDAPRMFILGGVKLGVSLGNLRNDPIGIDQIVIDKPTLVIEQANGKFNFQVLMDQQSAKSPDAGTPADGKRQEGEPIRLIIHNLAVNDASVVLRPGIPGMQKEIKLTIPSFSLKQIGTGEGNQNGAAIKEVVVLMVTTLAQKASQSGALPADVQKLLALNADQVRAQLQGEINKQVEKVTKELGKKLGADVGKQVGKSIEEGLGGLLNQNRKPTTAPQ